MASVLISINKATQRMTVTVDGKKRYTWPVSTGAIGYSTPSGSYRPFRMEQEHYSAEWDDAPMPYSIFFTPRGHAIHGSYQTRSLGRAVSHGCVRLAPSNAARLFKLVKDEGMGNTRVVVTGPGISIPKIALPKKTGSKRFVPPEPVRGSWIDR
jgi:lipoprotein-anchoring transpeptidase ErfK/SrfK